MNVKSNSINYQIDENGNTIAVQVSLAGTQDQDYINASFRLLPADLDLDDSTKTQLVAAAMAKLVSAVNAANGTKA